MESAWQRVESMHRWILENGGISMIYFTPCILLYYLEKRYIIKYAYNNL